MLLFATYSMKHLKMLFPSLVMFGVVPQYFLVWVAWRLVSSVLPTWMYQAGDDFYYAIYQRLVLFFFEHVTGTQVILHGNVDEVLSRKERVIYLSNHQSTVDWVVVHMLAERQGSVGNVRYVMKDSLQLIPLYGFYFYQHGCVFVKRKFFNGKKMTAALKYLQNRNIFSWMVIFPEGTRYNPECPAMLKNSRKFAEEKGLAPMTHVLTPKYRGLQMLLDNMKNNLDAVYDVTVIYSCTKGNKKGFRTKAPSMFEFVTGCCDTIHIHVNRVNITDIPSREMELKMWLYQCFQKKENMLESYYNGTIHPSSSHPLSNGIKSSSSLSRNFGSFMFFASLSVPFAISSMGRSLYLKTWFYGTFFGYFWLGIKSVC